MLGFPAPARYATALVAAIVATLVCLAMEPAWGPGLPYALFYPAILLAACAGGFGPGVTATLVSALGAGYFWPAPPHSWSMAEGSHFLGLLTFVGVGILISIVTELWRRGTARLIETERDFRRNQLVQDAAGQTEGGVGVCDDVTARRQPDHTFRRAVETTPAAMLMVDEPGKIVFANSLIEPVLGYTPDELRNQPVERLLPARLRERHAEYRANFLAELLRRPMGAGRDLHALHKDGREVPVEIGLSPLETAEGKLVLATVIDLTPRKVAERRLREADRRKDEFLATLAHELRNPLGAISSAVQVLKQLAPQEGDLRRAADVIDRQAAHVARMVDDLLDVSRISTGQLVVRREPMSLGKAVGLAVETTRPILDSRQQTLTSSVPPEPVWVDGDSARLAQVIGNLLSNASRYSPRGATVFLAMNREGTHAVLRVRDNGIGIAPEVLPGVFEPFVRAGRPSGAGAGGLGLGLTVARRIAEMHGGRIEASSAGLGHGSEFVVRIPTLSGEPPVTPGRPERDALPDRARWRILLVDDDTDYRDSLGLALAIAGQAVRLAVDGPSALAEAAEFRPDVALVDVGLPGMDGCEVGRRLKARTPGAGIIVVALTGWGGEDGPGRDSAFDDCLVKPASPQQVLSILARLMSDASPLRLASDGN